MANEVIQAFLTVASAVSSIVSIVAAIRNRHDKALRAMTWGLVGVSSFGLTTYCFRQPDPRMARACPVGGAGAGDACPQGTARQIHGGIDR
jgi:hypothetical protein